MSKKTKRQIEDEKDYGGRSLSISKQENFRFYKRKMNCFRLNLKLPNI